jgi:hypothetical protein
MEDDSSTAEVIRLVESKSFASQFKSDMVSLFSGSSIRSFAGDMKKIVPAKQEESNILPKEARSTGSKDMMISHLKKVYEE